MWLKRFTYYVECSNVPNSVKTKFLIACIGSSTYSILKKLAVPKLPTELSFIQVTDFLTTHFDPKPLVDVSRHQFRSHFQKEGESFSDYYAALKELISKCDFVEQTRLEEELRAQIIAGIKDKNLQRFCFSTSGLTLKSVVDKALALELAVAGVDHFEVKDSKVSGQEAGVLKINDSVKKKPFMRSGNSNPSRAGTSKTNYQRSDLLPTQNIRVQVMITRHRKLFATVVVGRITRVRNAVLRKLVTYLIYAVKVIKKFGIVRSIKHRVLISRLKRFVRLRLQLWIS